MAAGEKRSASGRQAGEPSRKRQTTRADNSATPALTGLTPEGGAVNALRGPQKETDDHLAGIALHKIVLNRAKNLQIQHACLHNRESDDGSCACCFAGGARAPQHRSDPARERCATTWHADVIGPTRDCGLGLDTFYKLAKVAQSHHASAGFDADGSHGV